MRNAAVVPINVHFQRFEFKYLIPARTVEGIIPELLHYMDFDPYALPLPDKSYEVQSLYFDSPGLDCYYQKVEGHRTRKKLRIRTYGRALTSSSKVFLEIKRKYDSVVVKDRVVMTQADCVAFMRDAHTPASRFIEGDQKTLDEFVWLLETNAMVPQNMVYYRRKPFFAKFDPGFRVTIDTALTTWRTRWFNEGDMKYAVDPLYAILEVKFHNVLPEWFHHLIGKYQLERVAYSKYCNALEVCHPELGGHRLADIFQLADSSPMSHN
ncbi:MAG: polyphosphate polymerase domain-containing protein [Patescibacteria group bacterium]